MRSNTEEMAFTGSLFSRDELLLFAHSLNLTFFLLIKLDYFPFLSSDVPFSILNYQIKKSIKSTASEKFLVRFFVIPLSSFIFMEFRCRLLHARIPKLIALLISLGVWDPLEDNTTSFTIRFMFFIDTDMFSKSKYTRCEVQKLNCSKLG